MLLFASLASTGEKSEIFGTALHQGKMFEKMKKKKNTLTGSQDEKESYAILNPNAKSMAKHENMS